MSLCRGKKLGPYEILALIGAGGMGEVYKARDTRLDRVVAIKVSAAQFSERFEREARAVAALNHPNICQLYDVGPDYLVMEYIEGIPVAPIDTARKLLNIAVQIADGLAAAHDAGITHRDLKPANILVTREGRVKILDFGLAKQVTGPKTGDATRTMDATDVGTILGTAAYMSPEQAKGEEADARSDQFSFGLIVYEMAAGKRPFPRESAAETMAAIIRDEAPPLPAHLPLPRFRRGVTLTNTLLREFGGFACWRHPPGGVSGEARRPYAAGGCGPQQAKHVLGKLRQATVPGRSHAGATCS